MIDLRLGDCLCTMPILDADSIDSIVTDPPYGLSFMGKDWDHGIPGIKYWYEALRIAKPGAHLLAFGGTRTHHRLMVAIEDAGWELRDTIMWIYGQGFPKSHNLKDEWEGWGTALKPAWEPIIMARKPLQGTVAETMALYSTGAINIDASRIETKESISPFGSPRKSSGGIMNKTSEPARDYKQNQKGRWPANLIHDGSDEVLLGFPQNVGSHGGGQSSFGGMFGNGKQAAQTVTDIGNAARFFYCAKASRQDRDEGLEDLQLRDASIGDQRPSGSMSQRIHSDEGRPDTLARNHHPTVKPTSLMRYLCRLITPPNGIILDPFMGSGSTGKAAMLEGFNFIGMEINPDYFAIAQKRIMEAQQQIVMELA